MAQAGYAQREEHTMNRLDKKSRNSWMTKARGLGLVGSIGVGLGLGLSLGGCVSYTSVPVPESTFAFESANHTQSIKVVAAAINAVQDRLPVDEPYLLNLPSGTTPETYSAIASQLSGDPMMPTEDMRDEFDLMPIYHIGRIWIRASDAKVDVIYPTKDALGNTVEQSLTLWVSGGVRPWRVHRFQHWAPGTIETPPMYVPVIETEQVESEPVEIESDEMESVDTEPVDSESTECEVTNEE